MQVNQLFERLVLNSKAPAEGEGAGEGEGEEAKGKLIGVMSR